MDQLTQPKQVTVKSGKTPTVAVRMRRETKRRIAAELAKINKKEFGKKVRVDEFITLALALALVEARDEPLLENSPSRIETKLFGEPCVAPNAESSKNPVETEAWGSSMERTGVRLVSGGVDQIGAGTGNVLQPKTAIISIVKTLPITFNRDVLHEKYIVQGRNLRQIAAEFSSSKTAVRGALVRFGIPLRGVGSGPTSPQALPFGKRRAGERVVDHAGEQRTLASILKMHREGLSQCAIARILTEMKVPTKRQGAGWRQETVRKILLRHTDREISGGSPGEPATDGSSGASDSRERQRRTQGD